MKVWITKYALTQGIEEAEAESSMHGNGIIVPGKYHHKFYRHGEYATSYEQAVEQAEALRDKKIISLEKQIAKIKNIKF